MTGNELALTRIPEVKVEMLIRRPPHVVFEALVDPDITTKFWFTRSNGRVEPGARLERVWEMYGASTHVPSSTSSATPIPSNSKTDDVQEANRTIRVIA